ncbi:MAG: patatin-like phospholipase family protein [Anaerolineae bacterium]|nr:patatin-like phospholipase family protein [Anaerolineae bacterium]MDW8070822.1 patatin-like phospholipase family protein [Anaerolineae bacterium]
MRDASLSARVERLRRIDFFKNLPSAVVADLAMRLRHERYRQGDVVFVEGSLGDSMYFIESGQLKISTGSGTQERVLNYLGPGNFFGEMAVLLNQRRMATVTVVIDADLWALRKADLDSLLEKYPAVALQITEELSRRLTDAIREPVKEHIYTRIAVLGDEPWVLAEALMRLTGERVALLDVSGTNLEQHSKYLPVELVVESVSPHAAAQEVTEKMSRLAGTHDRVLVWLPPDGFEACVKAAQLCEAGVLIDTPPYGWVSQLGLPTTWHISQTRAEIERVARHLARRVVGLALSSGGARGIAHVGVLKVLKREGIPIDMIAGTSAGALFGALFAAGRSIEMIVDFALNFHKKLNVWNLLDLAVPPRTGLVRGQRFLKYLRELYQDAVLEQLEIPFFAVAADVLTGEEVVLDRGPLADAVRASTSIVGILMPHCINDRYLIDGGAVNPLPASVLAERGAHVIIASRAIPTMEEEKAYRRASRGGHMDLIALVSNFQSIMEREIIQHRQGCVDVMITPQVAAYRPTDYRHAAELIRLGEEATERALPAIRKQLSPRISGVKTRS